MAARIRALVPDLPAAQVLDFAWSSFMGIIRPFQFRWELESLVDKVYRPQPPRVVAEIGTCGGGSLFVFTRLATYDALVISIDLPGGPFGGGYPQWRVPLFESFTRAGQKLHLIRADSHAAPTRHHVEGILAGRKIDFLFIDGDHTIEGVSRDFDIYSPFVRSGGAVAFHDVAEHPPASGCRVRDYWNDIRRQYPSCEFIDQPPLHRFGIGVLTMT